MKLTNNEVLVLAILFATSEVKVSFENIPSEMPDKFTKDLNLLVSKIFRQADLIN